MTGTKPPQRGGDRVAGYSATPLFAKLGVAPGAVLALIGAPPRVLPDPPDDVVVKRRARGRADVVVAFFTEQARLEARIAVLAEMIFPAGGLWIAWPKRSSGLFTDLGDNAVRKAALPLGLVDNKVCAIDRTWSGLRVVWRLDRRG